MIFKIFLILIGIFVIILYLFPLVETKLNFGNIVGFGIGFVLIGIGFLYNSLKEFVFFKAVLALIIICLLGFFIILSYIIKKSKQTATNEDVVIVLGCRVFGKKPSLSLIERCRVASEHLKKNESAVAILSGGQGQDEDLPEALAMKNLMLDFGIEEERLYLEDKSTTTDENFKLSKRIIDEKNLGNNIAIATSEYHEARALIIAKRYDLNASALPSKTLNRVKAPFFTREVFGIVKELLK